MFQRLRIPLRVVNSVQLGLVAGFACAGAWLVLPHGPSTQGMGETARIAARTLAEAIDQGLVSAAIDARSAALLLQGAQAGPDDGRRGALLREWLGLHPAYVDVMLVGSDGIVRVAGAAGFAGSTLAGQAWLRRARGAEIAVATDRGDVHLGIAAGDGHLVLRIGPSWFADLESRVRSGLGAPVPGLDLSVAGADGVLLSGVAPPRPLPRAAVEATAQTRGSRDLASAGWAVTSVMAASAATGLSPPGWTFALLVLAVAGGGAGLGYAIAARPARRLRRLAGPHAVAFESESDLTVAPQISEIDALEQARDGTRPRDDRSLSEARLGLDRVRARLRTFEAMSGWTLWEVNPLTRQVVWTDPGQGAAIGDRSIALADLIDGIAPADRPLMRRTMEAAMGEDGPHDVVLRTDQSGAGDGNGERRLLVRFRRSEVREDGGVRLLALSREIGECDEPTIAVNERRRDGALRKVTDGIVHDVNNALTVVTANLGLLKRRHALAAAEARLVDAALAGAASGAALTRRMAGLVRSDTNSFAEADLAATVTAALAFLRSHVLAEMPVMNRLPADLPAVHCNGQIIELALLNLAFHFRDSGFDGFAVAGSAHAAEAELPPGLSAGHHVRLVVASGRPSRKPSVPGSRADTSAGIRPLDAVTGLIEGIGGRFVVMADGLGPQPFLADLWLPAAERPPVHATQDPAGRHLRILLVESDSLVRACLAEILAELGHAVVQAASGEHALRLLASERAFDAMITDYAMPVMSGLQLAAAVVEDHPAVQVIIAGPHGHLPRTARQFLQLDKPFREGDLAAILATVGATATARAA